MALVDGYPASLVKGLLAASRAGRRLRLAEHTVALTVAVTGGLDLALNQGKGKILEQWLGEITAEVPTSQEKRPGMSERTFAFFSSLPRRKVN